jgi:quercetin dioxygenase-like cupin family protein
VDVLAIEGQAKGKRAVTHLVTCEKHWHGASPTTAMTHIAIQESLIGKVVDWMERVSDEQYGSAK